MFFNFILTKSLSRRYITVYSTPKTLTQQRIYDVLHHIHTFTSKKPATRYTPIVDWHDFKSTPEAVAIDFEPSGLALLADAVDALTASMEWEEKESTYEKESVSNF